LIALLLAGGAGGSSLITPDGSLVLILILFIVFVFVLNRVLFKPVGRVLDERANLTEGAMAEARAAVRQSENRLETYESALRQARGESYRFLEQKRAAAMEEREGIIQAAKQRAAEELDRAKSEIASQAAGARTSLEREAAGIARQIAYGVLGRTVGGGGD
jgi:F-type H+-transporting ATPase subunit b